MHFSKIALLVFMGASIAGCAVGPDFKAPDTPSTSRYTEKRLPAKTVSTTGAKAGNAQYFQAGRDVPAQWWTLFHSPALNALIRQGLKNSPTVEASQAAIRQAQENLNAAVASGLFPNASAALSASRERASESGFGVDSGSVFNLYNASVNVSYTLDLFGGARRYREGLRAQIDYSRFQLEAAYLTLSANIVTTAVNEASLRAQIRATEELIRSQEHQLSIVQKQFELGGVSQTDVLALRTQFAQTRATLPPLQKSLGQYRHSLAALIGTVPSEVRLPAFHLEDLKLPSELPISLPSRLVRQRPDVRASEALLHAASAQIGVAVANRLPQITLNGSYGSSTTESRDLFGPNSSIWSVGGALAQTLFDAGALHAKQRAAIAAYDEAAAEYKKTVLYAFQNVADALHAIQMDAQALKTQAEAEKVAHAAFSLVQQQYSLGAVSYLDRLDAERQYEETRIARIQAQAARYADTAALFQALGGGWWNRKS